MLGAGGARGSGIGVVNNILSKCAGQWGMVDMFAARRNINKSKSLGHDEGRSEKLL